MTNPNHGGAREGAGRPRKEARRKTINPSITALEQLQHIHPQLTRAIEMAAEHYTETKMNDYNPMSFNTVATISGCQSPAIESKNGGMAVDHVDLQMSANGDYGRFRATNYVSEVLPMINKNLADWLRENVTVDMTVSAIGKLGVPVDLVQWHREI